VEEIDPYAVLGVAPDATLSRIKQRYRELVKDCHPDLGDGPGRIEAFKRLTWAYQLLSDSVARATHDLETGRTNAHDPGLGGLPTGPTSTNDDRGNSDHDRAAADEAAVAHERERHIEELLATGRTRLAAGAWREAEDAGRFVLRWDKKNADAYVLIAEAMAARNRLVEARGCLCLALQLAPNHDEARRALSSLHNRQRTPAASKSDH
jgi:curved DNA-binding protein CbpA